MRDRIHELGTDTHDQGRRILVVHGDPAVQRLVRRVLEGHHHQVRTAADPRGGLDVLRSWHAPILICEFPAQTPARVAFWQDLKKEFTLQIIALLDKRTGKLCLESLELGADDYLVWPLPAAEVVARVTLASRRTRGARADHDPIRTPDLCIDLAEREVCAGGQTVHLTATEFELLRCLAANPGKVLPHAYLLDAIWGTKNMSRPQSLRVFVRQLRKKLEPEPDRPRYIITEPCVGYRFQLNSPATP